MKKFPKLNVTERSLSLIQDNLASAIDPLLKLPLSDSNLLEGIVLESGTNLINHKLGRPLRGWVVVRKNADESIYDDQENNALPAQKLSLVSSGDVTVDLIVF